ncbi:MAG: calcium-binding protein, partial [Cyanobacteria bacterium P01_G01_bin.19]
VNATNPRLPEDETVVEGPIVTGGSIAGTDEVAGSVFFRITDPTATIDIAVFDDDVAEGDENLSFSLVDGEDYEVDAAASGFDVTIVDESIVSDTPVVNIETSTPVVSEDEQPVAEFTITVDGEIPAGDEGLVVTVGGDVGQLFAPGFLDGNIPLAFDPPDGVVPVAFTGTEVVLGLTAPEVTATATIFDDIIEEEPLTLDFEILEGDGYTVGPDGVASVTFVDGDSVIPGSGPTVSLSVSDTDLVEGDELTVNFDVDGEIPDGGLQVFVAAGPTDIGEFVIFNEDGSPAVELEGINEFPLQGGDEGGFFVTLAENQASLTLSVFEDGGGEGEEVLDFELLNGEEYEVAAGAGEVSLTINDFNEIDSTDGNDRLNGTDSNDLILGGDGADRINGGAGNDVISGGADLDRLNGNDGNDSIFGGDRTDRINGGAGDDLLSGDGGNDEIRGGAGDDLLMGVTGNDTLIGEAGSDTFVFGNGDGTDRINDFDPSEDLIGLVDGELTFADISLTQEGNNTILGVSSTGEELALLVKVSADAISEDSFVTVPDISDIDDVI